MSSSYFPCLCIFLLWIPHAYMEKNSSVAVSAAVYVGCYHDTGGNRLLRARRQDFPQTLTPEVCIKYCYDNGFGFAGVEYSHECFCSKISPPDKRKSPEHECNAKCEGDKTKTCGGTERIGVYKTGAEEIVVEGISKGKYVGCYVDSIDRRIFNGLQEDFDNNLTPDLCVATCKQRGFAFAGTEFRFKCFCSHMLQPWEHKRRDESECNLECTGDSSIICGGDLRMSVYKTGLKERTLGYLKPANYLGCYLDGGNGKRILPDLQVDFPDSLNPDVCAALCLDKGYAYAGTEYRVQCFCSKTKPLEGFRVDESQCNFECSGNKTIHCGGDWRISAYKIEATEEEPVIKAPAAVYVGCYPDSGGNRLMRGLRQDFPTTLTPEVCSKYCFDNGYGFSGVEYSHECYCSKTAPPKNKKLPDHECNAKCEGDKTKTCGGTERIGVYKTGAEEIVVEGISEGKYVGCFVDGEDGRRMFNGLQEDFSNSLTPDVCVATCLQKGFAYAGTQYGVQCFCAHLLKPWEHKKRPETQCNYKCSGNSSINCGGDWRMSVYKTGIKEKTLGYVTPENYLGCYLDGGNGKRILPDLQVDFPNSLNPDVCAALCLDKGFAYAGTEYRVQCFCSNSKPLEGFLVDESQCFFECSGNNGIHCGGDWRISIYKIKAKAEPTVPPVIEISTSKSPTTSTTTHSGDSTPKPGDIKFEEEQPTIDVRSKREGGTGNFKSPKRSADGQF